MKKIILKSKIKTKTKQNKKMLPIFMFFFGLWNRESCGEKFFEKKFFFLGKIIDEVKLKIYDDDHHLEHWYWENEEKCSKMNRQWMRERERNVQKDICPVFVCVCVP